MIIIEFVLDHPVFRETLRRVPDAEITWEDAFKTATDRMQMIVWIDARDPGAVDAALEADPTVTGAKRLTETDDRRLYRIDYARIGRETSLVPVLYETGGVIQSAVGTSDGWQYQIRLPNREGVARVYEFCRAKDIDFTFLRLYEGREWPSDDGLGLSEPQRETLLEAARSGYLDIPRECSLAELGGRLGVSESAASERFRRGVKELVEQTLST